MAGSHFGVIQTIRKQRHKDVCAGQTADVFDELPDQHDHKIGREQPTDQRTGCHQQHADHRYVPFAELLGEWPHGKDTDAHRNSADHGNQHLRDAVFVGT